MANGILETGQGEISQAPTQINHIVRLGDLQGALGNVYQSGINITPLVVAVEAVDRRAAFVDTDGKLKTANNSFTGGAERVIGVFANSKLFTFGSVISGFANGSLERGKEYWIQSDGSLGTQGPPTGQDRWSVRVGIALNTNDFLVTYHNTGVV